MRKTFAVGRLTPKTAEIVLVDGSDRDDRKPFPGPWTLRALVRHLRSEPDPATGSRLVH